MIPRNCFVLEKFVVAKDGCFIDRNLEAECQIIMESDVPDLLRWRRPCNNVLERKTNWLFDISITCWNSARLLIIYMKSGRQICAPEVYVTEVGVASGHSTSPFADFNWSPAHISIIVLALDFNYFKNLCWYQWKRQFVIIGFFESFVVFKKLFLGGRYGWEFMSSFDRTVRFRLCLIVVSFAC